MKIIKKNSQIKKFTFIVGTSWQTVAFATPTPTDGSLPISAYNVLLKNKKEVEL